MKKCSFVKDQFATTPCLIEREGVRLWGEIGLSVRQGKERNRDGKVVVSSFENVCENNSQGRH